MIDRTATKGDIITGVSILFSNGEKVEVDDYMMALEQENAALKAQLAAKDNALSEIIELYDPYTNAPTDKFMYERAKAARGEDDAE